jgi:hypothetical protein
MKTEKEEMECCAELAMMMKVLQIKKLPEEAVVNQYLEILKPYSLSQVKEAIREAVRIGVTGKWWPIPTPGDLIALIEEQPEPERKPDPNARQIEFNTERTEAEKEEVRKIIKGILDMLDKKGKRPEMNRQGKDERVRVLRKQAKELKKEV